MDDQKTSLSKKQIAHLQRLKDANERLHACIKDLDETTLCSEKVMDDWSIKDILGHIVSWNEEFRANIAMILQGEHPLYDHSISDKDNFSDWNQAWIAEKRNLSLEQILADINRDYQEAVELVEGLKSGDYAKRGVTPWKEAVEREPGELTPDDMDSVETLVTFHWRHMNQHTYAIETWREHWESNLT